MRFVIQEEGDHQPIADALEAKLRGFNERVSGPLDSRVVSLVIRDRGGDLVGGLSGEAFWNAFVIRLLWVDERHQRRGYGAALVDRAERVATERACDVMYVSTFDFQAPDFYRKMGFREIGRLDNVPPRSNLRWLHKALGTVESPRTGSASA
jgi:ribosomal protein S18 acetylase RimI-like enzyme